MLQLGRNNVGSRYRAIPMELGSYGTSSRVLMLGDYLVHMNHLQLVYEMFPIPDHGLGLNDVQRSDRQNWRSAQNLTFPQVRNCLQMLMEGLVEGHPRNPSLLGNKIYLHVVRLYVVLI